MRRSILLAVLALTACGTLAACGKEEEPKSLAPPDVASNFAQPFDAVGADGSWSLKIRGVQLIFSRPGQPDIAANAPGALIQHGQASWTAAQPDGRNIKVSLYASPCSGPAGTDYAFTAEVVLPDQSPLIGCAGPPANAPRAAPASAPRTAAPALRPRQP